MSRQHLSKLVLQEARSVHRHVVVTIGNLREREGGEGREREGRGGERREGTLGKTDRIDEASSKPSTFHEYL